MVGRQAAAMVRMLPTARTRSREPRAPGTTLHVGCSNAGRPTWYHESRPHESQLPAYADTRKAPRGLAGARAAWGPVGRRSRRDAAPAGCGARDRPPHQLRRSEEHTSELQSLMRISYAVFCLQKKHKTPIYRNMT